MSTGSSRFRTGHVTAAATPAERVRKQMGDGNALYETSLELLEQLVRAPDEQAILDLLAVVREHDDPHRIYQVHRLAGAMLIAASNRVSGGKGDYSWAPFYDLVIAALMPQLERTPHEPELLNLVGLAFYELGETSVARRLFEAIKQIEPEHQQARVNLKACKERAKRGAAGVKVPDAATRHVRAWHGAAKALAERAEKLPDRTISLCMIVKDEEEMLPGCLDAVREHVDQIIVVDTGSSDRTKEIALERGATVLDFEWTGSFSDARNHSIKEATGDWILYLDADEHMLLEDAPLLHKLARKTWIEGFYLIETHFTGEYEVGSQTSHMALRLFQRRAHYHWQGVIHEQKMHNFPTWLPERFQNSPVRMNHYGYLRAVVEDRSKRERNLQLLMQQAGENEGDAFNQFNIGSEFGAMNEWAQARPYFERALTLSRQEHGWENQQFAPMMVSRLITSRRGTGDDDGALELIEEGLRYWPDFTDLVFERALIGSLRGDAESAMRDARLCLQMGDAAARYVAVQGKGTFQARALIASIARATGDIETAREELEAALAEAPHFLPTVLELADVMLKTDPADDVARHLDEQLGDRGSGASANLLLATAFYEAGELEHAERYYQRVLDAQPDHSAALIGMAELRLGQKRYRDAIALGERVDPLDPLATRMARTAFLAAVVEHDTDALADPLRLITSTEYLPIGERAFYTAWHARLTGGSAVLAHDSSAVDQTMLNLEALAKLGATDEFEMLVPLLTQAMPDERQRRMLLAELYLRRRFADMAAEEYMACAERFGPDPQILTGLGKAATLKEMWEDAEVFLSESLKLDPAQQDARKLLTLIRERQAV